jgi:hypothetical protein
MSTDRQNAMLEGVVQRLSLEPGISDVSWEVAASENEEWSTHVLRTRWF